MRIIAGEFGSRVIKSPDETTTRPTIDRVRESLFSAILSRLDEPEDVRVLDAFAGSGALGIEALSRGMADCLFFEKDTKARKVLEENLSTLRLAAPRAVVRGADVLASAARPLAGGSPFGLVMLDPPYAMETEQVLGFLENLAANGDLADDVLITYEHELPRRDQVAACLEQHEGFVLETQKKYGKTTAITFIRRAD